MPKKVFLTTGIAWTVPTDWNNANNSVECIGGDGAKSKVPLPPEDTLEWARTKVGRHELNENTSSGRVIHELLKNINHS